MLELIGRAATMHGGHERWSMLGEMSAAGVASGKLLDDKGCEGPIQSFIQIDTRGTSLTFFPSGPDRQRGHFTAGRVWLEALDGRLLANRDNPRESFAGHGRLTQWDPLHRLYFMGSAVWTCLALPMMFVMPGCRFDSAGHERAGNEWLARLDVELPPALPAHSRYLKAFVTDDGILRRVDYDIEVLGLGVSHYPTRWQDIDGMAVPTRHRIVGAGGGDTAGATTPELSLELNHVLMAQCADRLLEAFANGGLGAPPAG